MRRNNAETCGKASKGGGRMGKGGDGHGGVCVWVAVGHGSDLSLGGSGPGRMKGWRKGLLANQGLERS
jgi:hypothetical protein